jgi:hypothetical protein
MSNNKTFAISAFAGALLLLVMFGVKALLYAPIFLVAGLVMLFFAPNPDKQKKTKGSDKN